MPVQSKQGGHFWKLSRRSTIYRVCSSTRPTGIASWKGLISKHRVANTSKEVGFCKLCAWQWEGYAKERKGGGDLPENDMTALKLTTLFPRLENSLFSTLELFHKYIDKISRIIFVSELHWKYIRNQPEQEWVTISLLLSLLADCFSSELYITQDVGEAVWTSCA